MLQLSVNNHFTLPDEVGGYDGIFTMAGVGHTLKAEKTVESVFYSCLILPNTVLYWVR